MISLPHGAAACRQRSCAGQWNTAGRWTPMSVPTGGATSTPMILSILPGSWSYKRAKIAHSPIEDSGVGLMIHCVLHDPQDSVAVVVVEGIKAGQTLTGLILDENRTI